MSKEGLSLLAVVAALVAIGTIMVFSTSAVPREADGVSAYVLRRQVLWVVFSIFALWGALKINLETLKKYRNIILAGTVLLLAVVLVPQIGYAVGGARRWLRFGGYGFQPSEIAKIAIIIWAAAYLSDPPEKARTFFRGFLVPAIAIALVSGLVILEPDFGTALFIAFIGALVMIAAGVRFSYLVPAGIAGLAGVAAFGFLRLSHVRGRVLAFLDPEAHIAGRGYQVYQSLVALGSGGVFGEGLGNSRQKLFFLPEDSTDFILSIIGEELGFVGAAGVVVLFIAFVYYGAKMTMSARDRFRFLLSFGIIASIGWQALANVAVVTASVPTKGIALPFVSFGGSSLVISMAAVGLLLNANSRPDTSVVSAGPELEPEPEPVVAANPA